MLPTVYQPFFALFLIKGVTEALVKQIGLKICSDFIKTFTDPCGVLGCPEQYRHSDWFKNYSGSQTYLRDLSISQRLRDLKEYFLHVNRYQHTTKSRQNHFC